MSKPEKPVKHSNFHPEPVNWDIKDLQEKVKELEFKLKTLQNFVFNHHHTFITKENSVWNTETTMSKPVVWVEYPDGKREEPKENLEG